MLFLLFDGRKNSPKVLTILMHNCLERYFVRLMAENCTYSNNSCPLGWVENIKNHNFLEALSIKKRNMRGNNSNFKFLATGISIKYYRLVVNSNITKSNATKLIVAPHSIYIYKSTIITKGFKKIVIFHVFNPS